MRPLLPPMIDGAPLVGSAPAFFRDPLGVIEAGRRTHGPLFGLRLGPMRAAVILDPARANAMLDLPESTLAVRPVYQWVKPMFGEVMQAAPYADYLAQRAALVPALRGAHLGGYLRVMADEAAAWTAGLGATGTFDAVRDLERLSMNIALRLFLGSDIQARLGARVRSLFLDVAAGMEVFLPANFPAPRLLRRNRARRKLFALLRPEIQAVRADPDPERYGFFAHLVAASDTGTAGPAFDDETVIGLILILVYAAYESSAAQLAWVLILLLQHPRWLATVTAEVETGLPEKLGGTTTAELHRLENLGRCITEAQRIRPATSMLTRRAVADVPLGSYTVPRGWTLFFCPPVTHRDPETFPDPDAFDPDRFDPQRDPAGRAAAALLNLGAGSHACLGGRFAETEMKLTLAVLLRQYTVDLVEPDPRPAGGVGIARPAAPCPVRYRLRTAEKGRTHDAGSSADHDRVHR